MAPYCIRRYEKNSIVRVQFPYAECKIIKAVETEVCRIRVIVCSALLWPVV